jgi:imidazolonepropionase
MNEPSGLSLWRDARLATLQGNEPWGAIENGALLVQGERLVWVGELDDLPKQLAEQVTEEHHVHGAWITPGLVDCHTHLVYGGLRSREFEARLAGKSYEQIALAGGGIKSTVQATRLASESSLLKSARHRLEALKADGVTTIEIKSGYGLSLLDEGRMLQVARRLGHDGGVDVRTSYLALHALPPEFDGRSDAYVDATIHWLEGLHQHRLVDAVDAFCERIAFSPAQVERLFSAAQQLGLPVKLHAEQLSDSGGSQLAARFGALSCDHLEHLSTEGIAAMAKAGSVAVLLPGAFHFLKETKLPPVEALRQAGVPLAVSTDHNPGSSPLLSLPLAMHLACLHFGLSPEEALRGATHVAARALGLNDRGRLRSGLRADFCVWNVDHPRELSYWMAGRWLQLRVQAGRLDAFEPNA